MNPQQQHRQGNTLVVHVVSARDLHIRGHRPLDVYVSLSTSGSGPWKSKVTTNPIRVEPEQQQQETRWDEHCEFQLNDTDTKLVVHVNHKTLIGTTETLGELVLPLEGMARFQPAYWFPLNKPSIATEQRGQIQLSYQFSNRLATMGTSVSTMSLNKIEKEKKFDRLRRKMQQLGRSKKATASSSGRSTAGDDAQSLASVSIAAGLGIGGSRRSSLSSVGSAALAFSSPSPNAMMMARTPDGGAGGDDHPQHHRQPVGGVQHRTETKQQRSAEEDTQSVHSLATDLHRIPIQQQQHGCNTLPTRHGEARSFADVVLSNARSARRWSGAAPSPTVASALRQNAAAVVVIQQQASSGEESGNGHHLQPPSSADDRDSASVISASAPLSRTEQQLMTLPGETIPSMAPQRNNLKAKMRQKAEQLLQLGIGAKAKQDQQQQLMNMDEFGNGNNNHRHSGGSRRTSIASSSGFASLGSAGQLGALNEHTSPEYLLNVITHLRKELLKKEERIRDLEEYTDKLVHKVMTSNPELLQATPKKHSVHR